MIAVYVAGAASCAAVVLAIIVVVFTRQKRATRARNGMWNNLYVVYLQSEPRETEAVDWV